MAHLNVFDEHGGVFESNRVIDSQLTKLICSHSVDVIIVCCKTSVAVSTGDQSDRNVVRAELWESVDLIAS